MRRLLGLLVGLVVIVSACGETAKPGFTAAPPSAPTSTSAPVATPAPAAPSVQAGPSVPASSSAQPGGEALVLRVGDGLVSVDAATGKLGARLPAGVPDRQWSTVYAVTPGSGTTIVRALDVRTGAVLRQTEIAGSWALPSVVPDGLPDGLAEEAGLLVLVDAAPGADASRFALVDTALTAKPRLVTLNGRFDFDAVGPDGRYVFLIEQLAGGHYQVRAYNAQAGKLEEFVVVDKREIDEQMEGRPIARATTDDGAWALTLYEREDGTAFIHQLDTVNAGAFCVDLPETFAAISGAQTKAWRIAANPAGGGFVANDRLGFFGSVGQGELGAVVRLTNGVNGLASGAAGDAFLLEQTVLSVFSPNLVRAAYAAAVEGSSLAMSPSRDALFVLTRVGKVERIAVNGSSTSAAGTIELDPSVDWTDAALVGVAEE